ncbi:MAG: hypothetical protein ACRC4L_01340 [Mycoplasma sp.]
MDKKNLKYCETLIFDERLLLNWNIYYPIIFIKCELNNSAAILIIKKTSYNSKIECALYSQNIFSPIKLVDIHDPFSFPFELNYNINYDLGEFCGNFNDQFMIEKLFLNQFLGELIYGK